MLRFIILLITIITLNILIWPMQPICFGQTPNADPENPSKGSDLWNELSDGLNLSLRFLTFGTYQDIADSTQNPENDFLKVPRYLADLDLRPDAGLHFRRWDLNIKPRMNLQYKAWEDGTQKGEDDREDDWFINEWLCRLRVMDNFFTSYGRENLQWGPSFLFSPSNPFFSDNGRTNPKKELPGMDFARLVWLPNMEWTISLIMNMDEGRQEFTAWDFQKTYALKLDHMAPSGHAGLILAHQEEGREKIGVFGGWTTSDALLLYGDAGFSEGSHALYPVEDNNTLFGVSMQAKDQESKAWKGSAVLGGAYTFLAGPTLTVEYLYNGLGYNDEQANRYFQLRQNAFDAYVSHLWGLSRMTLSQTADPGLRFLRQNYAMLQYRQNNIRDKINLSLSWIQNLDDDSARFIANVDCYTGDHIEVFTIGSVNTGDKDTEFRTILDSFLMIGLEYTF
ncbi:MAG: hypothetical protein JW932_14465 [Deltaproteobacteria bacterium]|nr:hypothetical protein [Deltaproteobacteria bacterium]